MNRNIFAAAALIGALTVVWVGIGFVGTNVLALVMTAIIGAVYLLGALEILEFRRATAGLADALAAIPDGMASLDDWLDRLHPSLQNPVRLRIEGERIGLPGPALTPYLVGLLVMLGMLGTFLGMVVTLNGAVFALEGTTDLQAIRSALAAPIKGLGLAFGTSVAGVAASAMLGLISALSRRERMLTAQLLDTRIATVLRGFSLTHQRQETFRALQSQARALPEVVDKLQAMLDRMEQRELQVNERLLGNQESFHRDARGAYTELAGAVEKSLKDSLSESARVATAGIQPAVEAAMAGIAGEAQVLHERMIAATQAQLDALAARLGDSASRLQADQAAADRQRLEAWMQSLQATGATLHRQWQEAGAQTLAQQQGICTTLEQTARDIAATAQASASQTLGEATQLLAASGDLLRSRSAAEAEAARAHSERMEQLASLWRGELAALRDEEARRGQVAVDRLGELQTTLSANLATHLSTLGAALEEPMARLIQSASDAPRAAAEVIAQLRVEISNNIERDNQLLEERSRTVETLNSLLESINHAASGQRAAIDTLVSAAAAMLDQAGAQFAEQLGAESARLSGAAAQITGSAVDVASLSEAFGFAVKLFADGNEKLIAGLQGIEAALDKSTARSDEQLAYYVAQAREIIDLSTMSQKEIVDELRRLGERQALLAERVS